MAHFARELAKANISPTCSLKAANPGISGTLDVLVNGQSKTLYVGSQYADTVTTDGSTLDVGYLQNAYLFESNDLQPDNFFKPNLLGGTVEWDVDLSKTTCNCVNAFQLLNMPAVNGDATPQPGPSGLYTCDAYGVGGYYCAEFDLMQANMYGFQTEVHATGDRAGDCIQNTSSLSTEFGVGGTKIDTSYEFHVTVTFYELNSTLDYYTVIFRQGENEAGLTGDCRKNKNFTNLSEGLVFAFSSYGTQQAAWLQGTPQECDLSPTAEYPYVFCETDASAIISNLSITTVA